MEKPTAIPAPVSMYDPSVDPTDCWFSMDGSKGSGSLPGGGVAEEIACGSCASADRIDGTVVARFRGSRTMVLPALAKTTADLRIITSSRRSYCRIGAGGSESQK